MNRPFILFVKYSVQALLVSMAVYAGIFLYGEGFQDSFALLSGFFILMIFSGFYGYPGTAAALAALVVTWVFPGPELLEKITGLSRPQALPRLSFGVLYAAGILFSVLLAFVHHRNNDIIEKLKQRLRRRSIEDHRQKHTIESISQVYAVLEERVSKNQENISMLFRLFGKSSSGLKEVMQNLEEAMIVFAQAGKFTIRRIDPSTRMLTLVHAFGYDKTPPEEAIHEYGSIEGWVCRNNTMFSIRMLNRNIFPEQLYTGNTVMALPIHSGNRVWGVLSIEEMPFYRYNLHTEQLIDIVIRMAESLIERLSDYELPPETGTPDPVTGLQPTNVLAEMITLLLADSHSLAGIFSLVIVEITNIERLIPEAHDQRERKNVVKRLSEIAAKVSDNKARMFHTGNDIQLALLFTGLDNDGTAIFCLEFLGALSQYYWDFGGASRDIEILVGYTTSRDKHKNAGDMIARAAAMIDSQRGSNDGSL
ncbi:MAG: hypothetical protein JXB03_07555 [Spirochaetales bacterium]|nr:hypothetical protein [Spirochaetales bacterium]